MPLDPTTGRILDGEHLLVEAQESMLALRDRYPESVGDLPERLAVLQGMLEQLLWAERDDPWLIPIGPRS